MVWYHNIPIGVAAPTEDKHLMYDNVIIIRSSGTITTFNEIGMPICIAMCINNLRPHPQLM